jgi:hypothetical protein
MAAVKGAVFNAPAMRRAWTEHAGKVEGVPKSSILRVPGDSSLDHRLWGEFGRRQQALWA